MIEGGAEHLAKLWATLGIAPVTVEHPPVHTVEEARPHWHALEGAHTKNFFLKDNRGGAFYLVTVGAETRVDLKSLAPLIGARRLSFAGPDALAEVLGVEPGAVSPLGLVNDADRRATFVIERTLTEAARLTCHPLRNTATVALSWRELSTMLAALGVDPLIVDLAPAQS